MPLAGTGITKSSALRFLAGLCLIGQAHAIKLTDEETTEILRFAMSRTVSDATIWLRENSQDEQLHDPDFVAFLAVLPVLRSDIRLAVASRDEVWKLTETAALSKIPTVQRDQYYNDVLTCTRTQAESLKQRGISIDMRALQTEIEVVCFDSVAEIIRSRMYADCSDVEGAKPALCHDSH